MFALIDCNSFYASCERVFRPDLVDKPIVVLSNNDGCVIARCNLAKAAGIPMGAPAFKFQQVFKEKGVNVFSANFALYGDMSQRVMSILEDYTPDMEIYSIDEAFLKFNFATVIDLQKLGTEMRRRVLKGTGIPVSIGFAPTKALSKVANRIAKKYIEQTKNVYLIDTEEKRIKALKWLKTEDIWGIGRKHAQRLSAHGINNAHEFTLLEDDWVKKHLAIVGLRLKKDLEGIPTLDFEKVQAKRNIATTRSFEKNYTKFEELEERIVTFTVTCAEKLRKQNSFCSSLMVFLRTNRHRGELAQYNRSIVMQLPYPTNSSIELTHFAVLALKRIYKSGYAYKKAGVIIQDFSSQKQVTLFDNGEEKHEKLMQTVDALNATFGQQKIRLAAQDLQRVWKMKQEHLSPCYTTKLKDIIEVYAR